MVKSKPSEIDGADEKMLLEDEKKEAPNYEIAKKDLENDKQNGDAVLAIGEIFFCFLFTNINLLETWY